MPRDSFGNWVFYAGNPVVTGSTIASAWWNGTYNDIGSSIGASLDRTGATGGMTGQFRATNGIVGAPAISFGSDPTTGFYYPNPGDFRLSLQGVDLVKWANTTTAMTVIAAAGSDGLVVTAGAGNQQGIKGTATGTASGVWGVAGAATGVGGSFNGVSGGKAIWATSSAANVDVVKVDGYVDFSGATNPAATTGFTNRLTPKNLPKAFISFTTNGSGGVTVHDGFNVASVGLGVFGPQINFATAMGDTNYIVVGVAAAGQTLAFLTQTKATGNVNVRVFAFTDLGTPLNPNTNSFGVELAVFGAQ